MNPRQSSVARTSSPALSSLLSWSLSFLRSRMASSRRPVAPFISWRSRCLLSAASPVTSTLPFSSEYSMVTKESFPDLEKTRSTALPVPWFTKVASRWFLEALALASA